MPNNKCNKDTQNFFTKLWKKYLYFGYRGMKEIWRDIKDYEGLYQVSNLGRVRSVDRYVKHEEGGLRLLKGKYKKIQIFKCGYVYVELSKNGKSKYFRVHRLVAMTFPDLVDWIEEAKGKPFEELSVNHKDKNRTNNCVDNLEWCTVSYNNTYDDGAKKRGIKISKTLTNNPYTSKPVEQYTLDMVFVAEYPSTMEAERQTGIPCSGISKCCNNKLKTTGGYIWKYRE